MTAALAILLVVGGALVWTQRPRTLEPVPIESVAEDADEVRKDLSRYYEQEVAWSDCDEGFQCATVQVPMDYENPDAAQVTLALKRLPAGDPSTRLGSLLINPGGPGVSGISLVESADESFGQPVLASYDVVGFDPRGVGESTPIECLEDGEIDELRSKVYDFDSEDAFEEFREDMRELGEACEARTGALLQYVDTASAARDMDVLRAVLGDQRLNYLGYSYGTQLGATYAELFPGRVGRMVLDGAVDPTLSPSEQRYDQAAGFEAALRAYAEDCLAGEGCPLQGSVDEAVGEVQRFLELLEGSPLPTSSERELTQSLAVSGILITLYDDRFWPVLTQALDDALGAGDGSRLLFLADLLADREANGTYSSNTIVAIRAINCLDQRVPAERATMDAEAERLIEISPTFGPFLAYGDLNCDEWPVDVADGVGPIDAEGAAPILVIGTTRDPATPYEWAESLVEQLESAQLLTYDAQGHTAYGRANDCLEDAVDRYLLMGELPEEGLVC